MISITKTNLVYEDKKSISKKIGDSKVIADNITSISDATKFVFDIADQKNMFQLECQSPNQYPIEVESYTIEDSGVAIKTITLYKKDW